MKKEFGVTTHPLGTKLYAVNPDLDFLLKQTLEQLSANYIILGETLYGREFISFVLFEIQEKGDVVHRLQLAGWEWTF